MTLRYFPVAFGSFEHHDDLDVDPEVEGIARILGEFEAETVDWDVPPGRRDMSAASRRLADFEDVTEPCDTFLYWLGHGATDGMSVTLACADSPEDIGAHGIRADFLASSIARLQSHRLVQDRWTIVVVDTCRSAQFVRSVASELDRRPLPPRRVLLVGVSGEGATRLGEFRDALEHVVKNTFKASDITLHSLMQELGSRLPQATLRPLDLQDAVLRRRPHLPAGVTVDVFAQLKAMLAGLGADEREHFIPKAQGAELGEIAWYFEGRVEERREISQWLRTSPGGLLVVTGPAGSGKSALLGHLVEQSQPELRDLLIAAGLTKPVPDPDRPPDDAFDVVVHLSGMTVTSLVGELAARLGPAAPDRRLQPLVQAEELVRGLMRSGEPRTVLLDALDEAQEPLVIAREIVRRLAALPGVRVVVGTRSSTKETPDRQGPLDEDLLDALGDSRLVAVAPDPSAVTRYVSERLSARLGADPATLGRVGVVSRRIGGSFRQFLFARLAVHEILAEPDLIDHPAMLDTLLDSDHRELFASAVRRLTVREPAYGALLEALGHAKGRGLPILDGLWLKVAQSLQPEVEISERHIDELIEQAAPYLMVNVEFGQTVYRLAHATFVEHYRAHQAGPRKMFDALMAFAERKPDQDLNPYLKEYLAEHTAEAGPGAWRTLAHRPWTLDRLDPTTVALNAMRNLFGRGAVPPEIAGVIGAQHQLAELPPSERLGYRQLAMVRYGGVDRPSGYKGSRPAENQWSVQWAQFERSPIHLVLSDKCTEAKILTVFTDSTGRTLIAVGGKHLQICDPLLGHIVGQVRPPAKVSGLAAFTGPDGRTLLASGHTDERLCVWDPAEIVRGGEPEHVTFLGSRSIPIHALVAFTAPDGRDLLAVTSGRAICVYDPTARELVHRSVAGSHYKKYGLAVVRRQAGDDAVLSYGLDGIVRLWEFDGEQLSGKQIGPATRPITALTTLGTIGGRQRLALATATSALNAPYTFEIWNVGGSRLVQQRIHGAGIIRQLAAAKLPEGKRLMAAAGLSGAVMAWEAPDDPVKGTLLTGHTQRVRAVAMVPAADGRTLIASAGPDGTVRLWDPSIDDGSPRGQTQASSAASAALVLGHEGRRLIAARGGEAGIRLWDPGSGHRPTKIAEELGTVTSHVMLPGGPEGRPLLAATSTGSHTVQVWDVFADAEPESAYAVTPGRQLLLASGSADGTVQIWDPESGSPAGSPVAGGTAKPAGVSRLGSVAGPEGGHLLVVARSDGSLTIWDPSDSESAGRSIAAASGRLQALAAFAASDGRAAVVVGGADGKVRTWDALTGELVAQPSAGHRAAISALTAFTGPDGTDWLASAAVDGSIRIWPDVLDDGKSWTLQHRTGRVLAFAAFTGPEGGATLLATGDAEGVVRIFDPVTGEPRGRPLTGHGGAVLDLATYREGSGVTVLASAGADGTIRIWDPMDARSAAPPLRDPSGGVLGLARLIGRDGRVLLAGAGTDHVIRIWDTASGLIAGEIATGGGSVRALTALPFHSSDDGGEAGPDITLTPRMFAELPTGVQRLVPVVTQLRPALALLMTGKQPRMWDVTGSGDVRELGGRAQALAPAQDAWGHDILALADKTIVRLIDADTLEETGGICSHDSKIDLLIGVPSSAGVPSLITATRVGQILRWRLDGELPATLGHHARQVRALLVLALPDGEPVLVSGGGEGRVLVRSLESTRVRWTIQLPAAVRHIAGSDHGVLVTTDLGLVELALPSLGRG